MDDRTDLRVIDPPESLGSESVRTDQAGRTTPDARPDATVHGVVLAAGTSSRYGDPNKLLEVVDDRPLVLTATRTLLSADVDGVTVVVGHEADRVLEAIAPLEVEVRKNEAYAEGQSTSVATGIEAARQRDVDAVLVALGDMPDIDSESVDVVIETYRRGDGDAVAAAYNGNRGNPVLFDRRYFDALVGVEGDVGGREILRSDPDAIAVETGDPGVLYDVDRPTDI